MFRSIPSLPEFSAAYTNGKAQLLWQAEVNDLDSPVAMAMKLMENSQPCFLLESVHGGETRGRYSVIGLQPDLVWRAYGNKAEMNYAGSFADSDFQPVGGEALVSLKQLLRENRMDVPADLPPMAAGLIGYMGYDCVRLMERLPEPNADAIGIPDACFMRPRLNVVVDAAKGLTYLIAPVWPQDGVSAEDAYAQATTLLASTQATLRQPSIGTAYELADNEAGSPLEFKAHTSREYYHEMVERAKDYIRAGDIFQVVPSQRFSAEFKLPPMALYRALRYLNPSPFLFYLQFPGMTLIGSSPEILVRLKDGTVTIRPIAGTRKRGANAEEDAALKADLLADPKEISEHLMLLDLGRNDVGRVSKPGTVRVTEQMVVEHYSHVMHVVSNVEGTLDAARFDAVDALVAGFPAGTVSGAPKIRAMEIIDELEKEKRGFYAGCVGYFGANGSMDTCIALRTGLIHNERLYVQAGGGVVIDSDPEAEYQESWNKAQALMRAAQLATRFGTEGK
jgi:anthranilate synthase component 1